MAKKPNMQAALMGQTSKPEVPAPPPQAVRQPAAAGTASRAVRAPSREGKKQIGAWLNPDFDRSLLLIMAKSPSKMDKQTLIAEALNDLFRKYDVPVIEN